MNLLLLHGQAINSSRKKLLDVKSKFAESSVLVFEKGADPQAILGSLGAQSLFQEEQLIILENPPEDFNYVLSAIPPTLVLWYDHEVIAKKPVLEWIKKNGGQVLFFPAEKEVSVFPFLDLLGNKDKRSFVEMEKLKKNGQDSQYLITMIFYLLRSLINPNKNAPKFVKDKLARQQRNFPQDTVTKLYKFVLETDFKIKSGLLEPKHAEFLIVDKFVRGFD